MLSRASRWINLALVVLCAAAVSLAIFGLVALSSNRDQAILAACQDQNARHDATVRALSGVTTAQAQRAADVYVRLFKAAGLHLTKTTEANLRLFVHTQIRSQSSSTILLIDALAPHKDCQHVLHRANHGGE